MFNESFALLIQYFILIDSTFCTCVLIVIFYICLIGTNYWYLITLQLFDLAKINIYIYTPVTNPYMIYLE